tara:strand:+ start:172 stop:645 length:474 start_codon:yes stop_codon:yes gene_type:complete
MYLNIREHLPLVSIVLFFTLLSFFVLTYDYPENKEPKWLIYDNWKKIEIGMDEHSVERHLGKAIDVDYSATTFFYNATYRALQDPENAKAKIYSRFIYYIKDEVGTNFNWENWDNARKLESYGTVWVKEGKVYFFSANVSRKGDIRGFSISGGLSDL